MPNEPVNEPVLAYAPGSPERAALRAEIARQSASPAEIPLRLGGEARAGARRVPIRAPHRHDLELASYAAAGGDDARRAIEVALAVRQAWAETPFETRAAIFSRAAELLAGRYRQRLNAATLLGQSKTPHQAEIDAACELIDFFRFNVHFARRLHEAKLISPAGERNRLDLRPLEGFVAAITPFNFTSIAGNLATAPALLGNVVIWKPSPHAVLSAHVIDELLREAGLPEGVVQLLPGDAETIVEELLASRDFAGLSFTGSTSVFQRLFRRVGENIDAYRSVPRLIGETGGKDFIVAHPSAELDALAVAIVRGGFEYQGQKCSAASRIYVPRSLAAGLEARLRELIAQIKVGDPADFSCFMGAVIARSAYDRVTAAITRAKADPECRVIAGGGARDGEGFFVDPTLIEVRSPSHPLLSEELFGPVVAVFVYDDDRFEDVLSVCDRTSPYALTGSIFARDRAAVELASRALRFAAGNFYVNDKPTGAVVGQQPFGGSRASGTNDKAGSSGFLERWISPRVIKENFRPPLDFRYPYLLPESPA